MKRNAVAAIGRRKCKRSGKGENEAKIERNVSWEESRNYSGSSSLVFCLYKVTSLCMLIMYFAGNVLPLVARLVKIFSYVKISVYISYEIYKMSKWKLFYYARKGSKFC